MTERKEIEELFAQLGKLQGRPLGYVPGALVLDAYTPGTWPLEGKRVVLTGIVSASLGIFDTGTPEQVTLRFADVE